jgi:hypothetical protein
MTDLEMWKLGVSAVEKEYTTLPSAFLDSVKVRTKAIKQCKKSIHSFAEAMNGKEVCALCRGLYLSRALNGESARTSEKTDVSWSRNTAPLTA